MFLPFVVERIMHGEKNVNVIPIAVNCPYLGVVTGILGNRTTNKDKKPQTDYNTVNYGSAA